MVILTRKKYERDKVIGYALSSGGLTLGAVGIGMGLSSILMSKKTKTAMDKAILDIDISVTTCSDRCRDLSKCIRVIQDVLENKGMLEY